MVGVNPLFTHHMPEIWPEPEKFDPMRFTDEAQRNRHRFAWVPYGGGAHMCLGLHFAYMQAKCFARHFLQNLEVSLEPGYKPDWQMWPIPKPRDGLRVVLKAVLSCVGWAKERKRRAHHPSSSKPRDGGHAEPASGARSRDPWLCPPYKFAIHFTSVVSCAPSSATNTAINSAGSVMLALAETRCTAPGGSKND